MYKPPPPPPPCFPTSSESYSFAWPAPLLKGLELEVSLLRTKEGESSTLSLRLDLPGLDLDKEVSSLLGQLSDLHIRDEGLKRSKRAKEQDGFFAIQESGPGSRAGTELSYRCVAFPSWSLHEDEQCSCGHDDSTHYFTVTRVVRNPPSSVVIEKRMG